MRTEIIWRDWNTDRPEHSGLILYTDGHGIAKGMWHTGYGLNQTFPMYLNGNKEVNIIGWVFVKDLVPDG